MESSAVVSRASLEWRPDKSVNLCDQQHMGMVARIHGLGDYSVHLTGMRVLMDV